MADGKPEPSESATHSKHSKHTQNSNSCSKRQNNTNTHTQTDKILKKSQHMSSAKQQQKITSQVIYQLM